MNGPISTALAPLLTLALMMPAAGASVALGAGYGAIDAPRDIDAIGLGHRFCEARLLGDMSRIEGHVAPQLAALLEGLRPDDVPWQTVPERPTGCEIGLVNGVANTAGVLLSVHYTTDTLTWTDSIGLVRAPETWLITNVFYQTGGNLRFRLAERR